MRSFPIEYYVLKNVAPGGSGVVGYFAGLPILAEVIGPSGRRYCYAGLAPRLRDGRFDVASLRPGEWFLEPGLVYASDDADECRSPKSVQRARRLAGKGT